MKRSHHSVNSKKGQVAVEYVLLLIIAVSAALIIVAFVDVGERNNPNEAGSLIKYWRSVIQKIGSDPSS